jgi:hypothetical protein
MSDNECFLCKEENCYLATVNFDFRLYCSRFPDLDPDSSKPLHVLIAPIKHYVSVCDIPTEEYISFVLTVQRVENFFLSKGYGPAVTELRCELGPHTPHVHIHLIFSSNPLMPLRDREKIEVDTDFLNLIKKESLPLSVLKPQE